MDEQSHSLITRKSIPFGVVSFNKRQTVGRDLSGTKPRGNWTSDASTMHGMQLPSMLARNAPAGTNVGTLELAKFGEKFFVPKVACQNNLQT